MHVLFLTERMPYPLDTGGKIRSFHILKGLAAKHQVTLVTAATTEEQSYKDIFDDFCDSVHLVYRNSIAPVDALKRVASSLSGGNPIVVTKNFRRAMADVVAALAHQESFDSVHFDHLDSTAYHRFLNNPAHTVLDEHNIVTNQVITSEKAEKNMFKKLYMRSQIKPTRDYERRLCAQVDRCLVCSDSDKDYLAAISPAARIYVIPNGVDLDFFSQTLDGNRITHDAPNIIFVGAMDYGPGRIAMEYFIDRIWPILQESMPATTFTAVGQNPPDFLQELAAVDDRIEVTGRVDDVRPYVHAASVFVVPLLSGSGTRLKILDAMAMTIPIVSTSLGAEGLDVTHNESILLADDPQSFSDEIARVLSDNVLSDRLVENGLELVRQKYSWQKIWRDLHDVY